ncbi:MAG: ammonium transporter [Oscillospiraceae bacterium]|nr:ammonium transporter [Oscillospiraceae bacterium]
MEEIAREIGNELANGYWFLVGVSLVFFMNAGFAMLEAGFTRAKNTANILMKNLMDFGLGTICFLLIGYTIMMSAKHNGFIGVPDLSVFLDWGEFDYSDFIFNLVFCATAATIVSGGMAERTKFSAYCLYSIAITAFVYPVEAGWVWNGEGWLAVRGFTDFAGSAAIHMVGGISAFIGAAFLGPRLGKYVKDEKTGKKKARAIPGHSLTLGALGMFILWFGWYGFNGAAAGDPSELGAIFVTTTIAAAVGAVSTMLYTWIKNGNPDVSMSLNGALAGLVGITAGCAYLDAFGAAIVGLVAGVLVVVAVEVIDLKIHVDDPVGAVAVHGVNGVWGALAVGLFATYAPTDATGAGLFYGGGASLLGIQALGVVTIAGWTILTIGLVFFAIKKLHGLRVSEADEIMGLDFTEHGMESSSYADFLPAASAVPVSATAPAPVSPEVAVPVTDVSTGKKLTKVTIITKESRFEALDAAFARIGITGITVTNVLGYGLQRGARTYRGVAVDAQLLPKIQIDVVVSKVPVRTLIDTVKQVLYTGNIGDGKIFVSDVENVIKVRTGEEGYDALQDSEPGEE